MMRDTYGRRDFGGTLSKNFSLFKQDEKTVCTRKVLLLASWEVKGNFSSRHACCIVGRYPSEYLSVLK